MGKCGGIDNDKLNAAMEAFAVSLKREPMLSHVAEFILFNLKARGISTHSEQREKYTEIFLDGFSCGFCYLAIMLQENRASIHCLEIDGLLDSIKR